MALALPRIFFEPLPPSLRTEHLVEGAKEMHEATGNTETASNQSLICRSETRMSEFSDCAQEYGKKIADAASRATDYVEEKAGVVGEKLKNLQGKNFQEIA